MLIIAHNDHIVYDFAKLFLAVMFIESSSSAASDVYKRQDHIVYDFAKLFLAVMFIETVWRRDIHRKYKIVISALYREFPHKLHIAFGSFFR